MRMLLVHVNGTQSHASIPHPCATPQSYICHYQFACVTKLIHSSRCVYLTHECESHPIMPTNEGIRMWRCIHGAVYMVLYTWCCIYRVTQLYGVTQQASVVCSSLLHISMTLTLNDNDTHSYQRHAFIRMQRSFVRHACCSLVYMARLGIYIGM